ncbi:MULTISPECIES: hypothetical protein [Halorussus]|uniref:hypothetical protein n=1 Tax=Halorussus TaxID=1070314 RepID=UPI000E21587A|nr:MULTISPECIES: hypothetical protein [Halorussus]NHN60578.1 DUF1440 domain-containing protein [Halorussus sp. JP-T4]
MASRNPTEPLAGEETIERGVTVERTWSNAVLGGVAGGLVCGVLLQAMGTMPTIASLYGPEGATAGWVAHLFHSVVFALVFAAALGRTDYRDAGLVPITALGVGYGVVLWTVAAAVAMPLWLGALGLDAPAVPNLDALMLVGHVLYGAVLGAVFALARRG